MNRNTEAYFGNLPSLDMKRSKFKMPFSHKTTMNAGKIIPIFHKEILPGDSAKLKMSELIRMTTPIHPVMDNCYIDTYFFFIPRRLTWEHWQEFMGENTTDAWTQTIEYQIPQVTAPTGGWTKGSLADYFGIRTGVEGISVDAQYFRSYALCYNEWFRNENITEPAQIPMGDETTAGSNGTDYVTDLVKGGMPANAVKQADYFTRAQIEPQKGPDVLLPLGTTAPIKGNIPVIGTGEPLGLIGKRPNSETLDSYVIGNETNGVNVLTRYYATDPEVGENITDGGRHSGILGLHTNYPLSGVKGLTNQIYADLEQATAGTINKLRQAFSIQRLFEIDANAGTRYTEILRGHFHVTSPDARLQRPEYLGGKRVYINIQDIAQTSSTDNTSPQGNVGAMSKTIDTDDYVEASFVEHGIMLGLAVIRTEHTYSQGIPKEFSRKNRFDFYFPEMANLGEMQILNKEIFAQGTSEDDEIFGYQEAWAEYKFSPNYVTGELRPDYELSLDSYTYADDFEELPTLTNEFILETDVNVDRTLAITTQDQFIADFYFDLEMYRPMPIYSIPSLTGWF